MAVAVSRSKLDATTLKLLNRSLCVRVQILVAPVQGGHERPVTRVLFGSGLEEAKAVVESRRDLVERHQFDTCGRQFDGEGQPVEVIADREGVNVVLLGERETGSGFAGAFDEELIPRDTPAPRRGT